MTARVVTDGGLETDLIFHHGVELPHFAAFPLLDDRLGRALLTGYFAAYAQVAREAGAELLLESPTWRANPDWGTRLGYDRQSLERVNRDAVGLMHDVAAEYAAGLVVEVAGMLGPRRDGYASGEGLDPARAADYHRPQLEAFSDAGADRATVLTLTDVGEAIGVARAAAEVGLPLGLGFTVEVDGRLPDGTTLAAAIEQVDDDAPTDHYLVNCAHPQHVARGLAGDGSDVAGSAQDGGWRRRVDGVRYNASTLSHAELDESDELDDGDPDRLALDAGRVAALLPALRVLGGCCGTDVRHVRALWGLPARG